MIESKKMYWLLQTLGWSAYAMLIFLSIWTSGQTLSKEIGIQLGINVIVCLLMSHIIRCVIVRYNWFNDKLLNIVLKVIITCAFTGFLVQLIYTSISYFLLGIDHNHPLSKSLINGFAYALVLLCWNGIYFTYLFFQKSKNQEVQTVHLKASKNEMQLKSLRNQLNPHFLFNALNSIRALVDLDPKKAKDATTQLSNLLRKTLVLGDQNTITIEQELEIIKHYLQLEKIRFEERLNYTICIENEVVLSQSIPPFLMQNLVENAVKHGVSKEVNGSDIFINCSFVGSTVYLKISNKGNLTFTEQQGIGIQNTQQRLKLLYNDSATFSLQQDGDQVVATIYYTI